MTAPNFTNSLPLRLAGLIEDEGREIVAGSEFSPLTVAVVHGDDYARLIVTAVNTHSALVDALRASERAFGAIASILTNGERGTTGLLARNALDTIREALALATPSEDTP